MKRYVSLLITSGFGDSLLQLSYDYPIDLLRIQPGWSCRRAPVVWMGFNVGAKYYRHKDIEKVLIYLRR